MIHSKIHQIWNKLSLLQTDSVAKTYSILISTKQKHNILKSQNEVMELNIRNNKLDVVQKNKVPWCTN